MRSLLARLRDGAWLDAERLRVYPRIFLAFFLLIGCLWVGLADGLRDPVGTPIGADFLNVYAAGVMTHEGRAPLVYQWHEERPVEASIAGYPHSPFYSWHYPPPFFAVSWLVALLPYVPALLLYLGIGLAFFLLVYRPLLPPLRGAFLTLLSFPGVFLTLANGQNGFLTASFFGAGALFLERSPFLAGLFWGCLVYKPHFLVLLPFALLVARKGRALAGCVLSASAILGLSFLAFGAEAWQAFFICSKTLTRPYVLEAGAAGWDKIQSFFSLTRALGGSVALAYCVQGLCAVACFAFIAWLWNGKASLALKLSGLAFCALLFTPYVLDYDLALLALPLCLWSAEGLRTGFRPYEKSLLALLWLWPLLARKTGIPLSPFLLSAALGLLISRASKSRCPAADTCSR